MINAPLWSGTSSQNTRQDSRKPSWPGWPWTWNGPPQRFQLVKDKLVFLSTCNKQQEFAQLPYTRRMDKEEFASALIWGSYFCFLSTHDHINPGKVDAESRKWVFLRGCHQRSSLVEWLDSCLTVLLLSFKDVKKLSFYFLGLRVYLYVSACTRVQVSSLHMILLGLYLQALGATWNGCWELNSGSLEK